MHLYETIECVWRLISGRPQKARYMQNRFPFPKEEKLGSPADELVGFRYTTSFQNAIRKERLYNYHFNTSKKLHLLLTKKESEKEHHLSKISGRHKRYQCHFIPDAGDWDDATQREVAILPSHIIQKIVEIIKNEAQS